MSLFNFFYAVPRFETSIFPNSVKAMRLTQQVHCFELPPPFRLELILDLRGQLFVSGIAINAFNFFFSQFWQPLILYSVKAWGDHFPPLQWQVNISLCTPSSRTKKFYHFDSVNGIWILIPISPFLMLLLMCYDPSCIWYDYRTSVLLFVQWHRFEISVVCIRVGGWTTFSPTASSVYFHGSFRNCLESLPMIWVVKSIILPFLVLSPGNISRAQHANKNDWHGFTCWSSDVGFFLS